MIVTFISGKYRCGSELGVYAEDRPGYLENLNKIIEFDKCKYPEKFTESEDKTKYVATEMTVQEYFEGKEPKLEPGHMFIHDGQIFAIDSPDRLVLAMSETGALAARRFLDEVVGSELELRKVDPDWDTRNVVVSEVTEIPEEILENEDPIPYYLGKIWRGRTNLPDKFRVTFCSNYSFIPVELFFSGQTAYYSKNMFTEEEADCLIIEFMCYSYREALGEKS